jgi:pyruvate/2-oxoacid:ferredoxin oxidoreductase beta subunit
MFDSLKKNADIYVSLEETDQVMTWCDDCGNYGIQKALFQALTLKDAPKRLSLLMMSVVLEMNLIK